MLLSNNHSEQFTDYSYLDYARPLLYFLLTIWILSILFLPLHLEFKQNLHVPIFYLLAATVICSVGKGIYTVKQKEVLDCLRL